jgi:hypothetical protein
VITLDHHAFGLWDDPCWTSREGSLELIELSFFFYQVRSTGLLENVSAEQRKVQEVCKIIEIKKITELFSEKNEEKISNMISCLPKSAVKVDSSGFKTRTFETPVRHSTNLAIDWRRVL